MGAYFTQTTCRLVPGKDRTYDHRFGGKPRHQGINPPGKTKPVTLLYDLDLRDPKLGLSELFPGLARLPLLNALQFNCTDLLYHVVGDDRVELLPISEGTEWSPTTWDRHFPFKNYPQYLPESPIRCAPYELHLKEALIELNKPWDVFNTKHKEAFRPFKKVLKRFAYPFPVIGEKVFMMQGFPEWKCPEPKTKCSKTMDSRNKQVFAVIWEWPLPTFNLWSNDPEYPKPCSMNHHNVQIIFSRCKSCGIIHSCNRCD